MENETKEILKFLGNTHTKVKTKEDFKGNYYSCLTDTIYTSKNFGEQKFPKEAKDINPKAAMLIVACHECIHSKQSKCMHILNTIFSNLSMVLAVICIALEMFWIGSLWLKILTGVIIITSITIRLILEVEAVNGSTKLAVDIIEETKEQRVSKKDIEASEKYMAKYKCLVFLRMVLDKIILLILVLGLIAISP